MKLILSIFVMAIAMNAQAARNQAGSSTSSESAPHAFSATSPSIQIKAGLGFTNISQSVPQGAQADDTGNATGLNVGAYIDLPINTMFSINTGLNFVQKGYSTAVAQGVDQTVKVSYLVIPAMAKLNFGEKSARFSVAAGPYAGLKMGLSASQSANGQSISLETNSDAVSALDFGVRAGINAEFPMSSSLSFLVGADYDLGLKNVVNTQANVPAAFETSTKTRALLANVGVGLRI
ncbi:MAG: PorT family protein [Bdellovibrionales bacterium]|nr:PorT family protein [Bdellovibrionales bacterium]